MTAVAVIVTALAVVVVMTAYHDHRTDRLVEDSHKSGYDSGYGQGYAAGQRHARADANEDFFNKRGARR